MILVIVVAAGRSTRMAQLAIGQSGALSSAPDKLFLPLGDCPLLVHSLNRIQGCAEVSEIIVVTRSERRGDIEMFVAKYSLTKVRQIVDGGDERQDSVWNGLQSVSETADLVAVHDGARPFFPSTLMTQLIQLARTHGSAVVCTPVTDTIKQVDERLAVVRTVDRSCLRAVQTPQVFQTALLKRAYSNVRDKRLAVTDEAAAVEALGEPVYLLENPHPNPKVTTPLDLNFAELLLNPALA